jgi:hypothetical protein
MPKLIAELAEPSIRAKRIAKGLISTGRAYAATRALGYICLRSATGGFYWVANDGALVLRGDNIKTAESLQVGFISAMERAGARVS